MFEDSKNLQQINEEAKKIQTRLKSPGKRFKHSTGLGRVEVFNFLSTVIFNLNHVPFFGIFCHFFRPSLLHWVSAKKEPLVGHKKGVFWPFLWPSQWFFCGTDSVQRTNFNEMPINAKKENIVKIEIHCTKKNSMGYLNTEILSCIKIWFLGDPLIRGEGDITKI